MNKFLRVDRFFCKLDDNFNGSLADAFRIAARILDEPRVKPKKMPSKEDINFEEFFKMVHSEGRDILGGAAVQFIEDGKCVNQPHKLVWKDE